MQSKAIFLALFFCVLNLTRVVGQADPGSAGITFSKSIFQEKEPGTLRVLIGNYTDGISSGTALKPYDATFTITIPSLFNVTGDIDFKGVPFPLTIVSQMMNAFGSTIIVLTVPKGIPKGASGAVVIPVQAVAGNANILYATVKTDCNLSYPPSGNILPGNDLLSAPIVVVTPLPVTLSSFKLSRENLHINLSWTTTSEENSERFDIERSQNGKQWEFIGTVASASESSVRKNYNFSDLNPENGTNYYRLKMIDKDQSFTYSTIRQAVFQDIMLELYPNPVAETLYVRLGDWSEVSHIQLLNPDGTTIYHSGNVLSKTIDVSLLNTGTYIFKLQKKNSSVITQRIFVAK